ncbi:hypothetical protein [Ruminococcus sp.]|uniref:hypothetical protein n=1 Tax=Ruminococcus sp. TaxID=41978 RepID=UPI0025E2BFC8|nr:hypothetical protein [Ruminococcus sp.]
MKNPFKKFIKQQVKLEFSTCGEVMIDGLPFAFGVESAGKASDKGLCVSISGDAVNDGRVTFSDVEYYENHGGKITVVKYDLKLVTKSDGKKIYQAKFSKIPITEKDTSVLFRKMTEEEVIQRINCEIAFKVTPHFNGDDTPEVMLTVYPYENLLTGSAVQWLNVTSDQDYFLHKYTKNK